MSLFGALNIGGSALSAQQAALQVTGNNIANSGNANYTREVADLTPAPSQQIQPGIFQGTGVTLVDIQRQVDESLNSRLRGSDSDSQAATTTQTWMSQVESSFNALGTNNISTQMSTFFSGWSSLANTPQDPGLRQVVLSDGSSVAESLTNEQTQLTNIQSSVQQQIGSDAQAADGYAQQIADLNRQIVVSSNGTAGADNSLMDQRDTILTKLSGLMNIQTVQQNDGAVNVYVGSEPLVDNTVSNGVKVEQQTVNGEPVSTVVFKANGGPLPLSSGELGALQTTQTQVSNVAGQVNALAHNLIAAVNQIHASGQGTAGFTSVTGADAVKDPTAALNSTAAGLTFPPTNGSFVIHVTNTASGIGASTLVPVNLTGSPTDTTLNSLAASLNAIKGVTASVANGKLTVASSDPGSTISFSQDSSGALAGLGINTFFTGSDASDIAVNQTVQNDPSLINAAQNGDAGDNQTATAIAALNTQSLASLNGVSLQDSYQAVVDGVSGQVATANTDAQAAQAVKDTLTTQQQSLSGVSIDEESVNMLVQQRAYQGAAIFITTVNNMMTSLLAMIP
ncbi:MAG TPA: flagellar hook-associated protein FlgK [Tepidisphaeraceae bacterium]|jgi:flagellar hook-associated protein 1 FlgK|nr:flagellar hook-associated protein FlgK [Tepidisphaeraceae bacterium]